MLEEKSLEALFLLSQFRRRVLLCGTTVEASNQLFNFFDRSLGSNNKNVVSAWVRGNASRSMNVDELFVVNRLYLFLQVVWLRVEQLNRFRRLVPPHQLIRQHFFNKLFQLVDIFFVTKDENKS